MLVNKLVGILLLHLIFKLLYIWYASVKGLFILPLLFCVFDGDGGGVRSVAWTRLHNIYA